MGPGILQLHRIVGPFREFGQGVAGQAGLRWPVGISGVDGAEARAFEPFLPRRLRVWSGMASRTSDRRDPVLALNAVRIEMPPGPLPASVVPFEREALYGFLDRDPMDVFARRLDAGDMAVVPLTSDAALPGPRRDLRAQDHPSLVSALAREAVFRLLLDLRDQGYRVTGRRPPVVETARFENELPEGLGLPDWLKKRVVIQFDTRVLHRRGVPQVVLTCSKRLRTVIGAPVSELRRLGVPLLGASVSAFAEGRDPRVVGRLRYAGRIMAVEDDGTLTLEDSGEGPAQVPETDLQLEPSRANFVAVVEALTQGRAERVLKEVQAIEASWHAGPATLGLVRSTLGWISRRDMHLADGVPLVFGDPLDLGIDGGRFLPATRIWKPKLSFDPGGAPEARSRTPQMGLDEFGPYDRERFPRKSLRIAVVCEAGMLRRTEEAVRDFLHGLPDVSSGGPRPLVPHRTGFLGRFRLREPEVRYFTAAGHDGGAYADAVRRANADAAGRDETWDLALVQVRREWQERPHDDSPYWMTKAAFLKQGTPMQALTVEMIGLPDFEYACSLANMGLATYAKAGGVPWLLPTSRSDAHELVFGLGSHVVKDGRRGGGQRVIGIATVFSAQGHYVLDSRTTSVTYGCLPEELKHLVVRAVERIRDDEVWQPGDPVRLVFHAFTELGREVADAVVEAVRELGRGRIDFAFLHVAEDHPFTAFDLAAPQEGKGALAPERGQAIDLSDREWLVSLTGSGQLRGDRQGLPDPVLLKLHHLSTYRNMGALANQVSDFACHSWRTFGPSRLPITLSYADQIARQVAGLERTPNWDPDALETNRVMRRPWFL